jgi:U5 snRNP spliceosome subunit
MSERNGDDAPQDPRDGRGHRRGGGERPGQPPWPPQQPPYPQGGPPRGGYPPYGPPPGAPPPGGPHRPPYRESGSPGVVIATTFAGVFLMGLINVGVALLVLILGHQAEPNIAVGFGAAALVLIAFAGGFGLIGLRRPWTKGLGLGLMIGWALISVVSAGYCTGLNPELYV